MKTFFPATGESQAVQIHEDDVTTGQGPGPEWVCLGTAGSVWVLDFTYRKDFTARVQVM